MAVLAEVDREEENDLQIKRQKETICKLSIIMIIWRARASLLTHVIKKYIPPSKTTLPFGDVYRTLTMMVHVKYLLLRSI